MQHLRRQPDARTGLRQRTQRAAARDVGQAVVRARRDQQLHRHAAPRRQAQRHQQRRIGHEVRRHQRDAAPRLVGRAEQQRIDRVVDLVRARGDQLRAVRRRVASASSSGGISCGARSVLAKAQSRSNSASACSTSGPARSKLRSCQARLAGFAFEVFRGQVAPAAPQPARFESRRRRSASCGGRAGWCGPSAANAAAARTAPRWRRQRATASRFGRPAIRLPMPSSSRRTRTPARALAHSLSMTCWPTRVAAEDEGAQVDRLLRGVQVAPQRLQRLAAVGMDLQFAVGRRRGLAQRMQASAAPTSHRAPAARRSGRAPSAAAPACASRRPGTSAAPHRAAAA